MMHAFCSFCPDSRIIASINHLNMDLTHKSKHFGNVNQTRKILSADANTNVVQGMRDVCRQYSVVWRTCSLLRANHYFYLPHKTATKTLQSLTLPKQIECVHAAEGPLNIGFG